MKLVVDGDEIIAMPVHLGREGGKERRTIDRMVRIKFDAAADPHQFQKEFLALFGAQRILAVDVSGSRYRNVPEAPLVLGERMAITLPDGAIGANVDGYHQRVIVVVDASAGVRILAPQIIWRDAIRNLPLVDERFSSRACDIFGVNYFSFHRPRKYRRKMRPAAEYLAMEEARAAKAIADDFEALVNSRSKHPLITGLDDPRIVEIPATFESGSLGGLREWLSDIFTAYAEDAWGFERDDEFWPLSVFAPIRSELALKRGLQAFTSQHPPERISWSDEAAAKRHLLLAFSANRCFSQRYTTTQSWFERCRPSRIECSRWWMTWENLDIEIPSPTSHERLEAMARLDARSAS